MAFGFQPAPPTTNLNRLHKLSSRTTHKAPRRYPTPLLLSKTNDGIDLAPHYTSSSVLDWLEKMAISYKIERGENLADVILREGPPENQNLYQNQKNPKLQLAALCAQTPLPIASHDFLRADDAIYCYGNNAFLTGFGYDWDEFVEMPSKKCVETDDEVAERQRFLDAVKETAVKKSEGETIAEEDLASNHDNLIRVRKDKGRILLKGVNLWNVYDIDCNDDVESVRGAIERGETKVIGQAVWIKTVEYL